MAQEKCKHGINPAWCAFCLRKRDRRSAIAYSTPPEDEENETGIDRDRYGEEDPEKNSEEEDEWNDLSVDGEGDREQLVKSVPVIVSAPQVSRHSNPDLPSLLTSMGICSVCKERKRVHRNCKTGEPICPNCYHRSKVGRCADCKKTKVIQAHELCGACYQRQRRAKVATSPA